MDRIPLHAGVLDLDRRQFERDGDIVALTDREVAVLVRLITAVGTVVTREALEREIWELAPSVRSEAVPVAMRRLRDKLERDPDHPVHLHVVRGSGWTFVLPERPHRRSNLSGVVPTLVGREPDLARLAAQEPGWTTVWGAPGVGKSALVRVAAAAALDTLDTLWWIDVDSHASVDAALHSALALSERASLDTALADRGRALIVVDVRGAGLPDDAGTAIPHWLAFGPGLRVWLVGRTPVGDPRERRIEIDVLPRSASEQLFVSRATSAGAGDVADAPELALLLEHLGDLPLAIELAAAATPVLTPAELVVRAEAGRLGEQLRAAFGWARDLLSPASRELLARLTPFEGWFERRWAEGVAGPLDVPQGLLELVARRLVQARASTPREFRVDPSIRRFAADERPPDAVDRHRGCVLALAEACVPEIPGPDGPARVAALRRLDADLAAAAREAPPALQVRLRWVRMLGMRTHGVVSPHGYPLAEPVPEAAGQAGAPLAACRALWRWVDAPDDADRDLAWATSQDPDHPWVLQARARRALMGRRWAEAAELARAAHQRAVACADPLVEADASGALAFALEYQGDTLGAGRAIRRGLAAARARGDRYGEAELLAHRSAWDGLPLAEQLLVLDRAVAAARAVGARALRVAAELRRVDVLIALERVADARSALDQTRDDARSCRSADLARLYELDAEVALIEGRLDDVEAIAAFALAWPPCRTIGSSEGTIRVVAALAEASRGDGHTAVETVRPASIRPSRIQPLATAVLAGLLAFVHRIDEARSTLAAIPDLPFEPEVLAIGVGIADGWLALRAGEQPRLAEVEALRPTGVLRVWLDLLRSHTR